MIAYLHTSQLPSDIINVNIMISMCIFLLCLYFFGEEFFGMLAHYVHIVTLLYTQHVLGLVLNDIQEAYWKSSYRMCAGRLHPIGGHRPRKICFAHLEKYLKNLPENKYKSLHKREFVYEAHDSTKNLSQSYISDNYVVINIPVHELVNLVSVNLARAIVSYMWV